MNTRRALAAGVLVVAAGCGWHPHPHPVPTTTPAPTASSVAPTSAAPTSTPPATTTPPGTVTPPSTPTAPPWLPDPALAPGATNPAVTQATIGQTICVVGWTATIRPSSTYTGQVKADEINGTGGVVSWQGVSYRVPAYHLTDRVFADYELDHLISLELGGSAADPANLWPEPGGTAHVPVLAPDGGQANSIAKDGFENWLKRQVCAGALPLVKAQQEIATDWYRWFVAAGRP